MTGGTPPPYQPNQPPPCQPTSTPPTRPSLLSRRPRNRRQWALLGCGGLFALCTACFLLSAIIGAIAGDPTPTAQRAASAPAGTVAVAAAAASPTLVATATTMPPTMTPAPTAAPTVVPTVAPTVVNIPPSTPVPATATVAPSPSLTSVPVAVVVPTDTPVPPTAMLVPPTVTAVPPTPTIVPPTITPALTFAPLTATSIPPTPAVAYKWQVTVETVERVELSGVIAGNGFTWLLLRTKATNSGTGSSSVREQDFSLTVDGQAIRAHKDAVEEIAKRTNDKGFGRVLGTSIRPGASETRILVFLIPTQTKALALHLNKDEQSTADLAVPIDLAARVAQAPAAPTPTPPPTPTEKPPTPTPRPTPTPTSVTDAQTRAYGVQLERTSRNLRDSFSRFSKLLEKPAPADRNWQISLAVELGTWKGAYADAQTWEPPPELQDVHDLYVSALEQYDGAADDIAYAMDNFGTPEGNRRLDRANLRLSEGNRLLNESTKLLREKQ